VYESFDGWQTDITGVTRLEDLPRAARAYLDAIEKLGGAPVTAAFVGPDREQTLLRESQPGGSGGAERSHAPPDDRGA
jgi:adenylosuccinate synthase